jgi:tetratricopeptide (TPR) repeat protein
LRQPVERELGPGQIDEYIVSVNAGIFLHIAVEKRGVALAVVLVDPLGRRLVTADSPNGAFGPQPASLIPDRGGEYRIRVEKSARTAETGRYRIELTEIHAPTTQDRERIQAESDLFNAAANERQQDRVKRQQAIVAYQRSVAGWHSLRDDFEEALCLHRIGALYAALGDKRKGLEYDAQALTLRQAAGDRAGEADTLNNMGGVYSELGQKQKAFEYYNRVLPRRREVGNEGSAAQALSSGAYC